MKVWGEVMLAVAAAAGIGLVLWWNGQSDQIRISGLLANVPVLALLVGTGILVMRLGFAKLRAKGRGDIVKAISVIVLILFLPIFLGTVTREYAVLLLWSGYLVAISSIPLSFMLKPKTASR